MAPRKPRKLGFKREISIKRPRKSMKLGGLLRPYPVNISPKNLVLKINESREKSGRSKGIGVFSRTQEIEFEHACDSRGFRTGLEARELQQRTHGLLTIKCTKNKIEISSNKAQNEEID